MASCDTLIRNATVVDGSGTTPRVVDVAIAEDRICAVGPELQLNAAHTIDAMGRTLAPGFIDAHTHDDTSAIETPAMTAKISQGVTTVVVGNCGISASPVRPRGSLPDPMNLLGSVELFRYPTFASYRTAIAAARPAVNVAALVGHTALRSNHMERLDTAANSGQIRAMKEQLAESLDGGALGLSTGLAYSSARAATTQEVVDLAKPLAEAGALYATHMRTETDAILGALEEAFEIGRKSRVPVVVSHLKCAGIANWGRGGEVLTALEMHRATQKGGCDCYPYAAGSSTLDLGQVDPRVEIMITWSEPHPEQAGLPLCAIAAAWQVEQIEAARRLQPAGAIYHSISEDDMRRILSHPATMIGSDGLPHDPRPHPRLWGTFPRVLGRYSRDERLFSLQEAIRKMTGMPAQRFGLAERGLICEGYFADLVLFDAATIHDTATFADPTHPAEGIECVWVNGALTYAAKGATGLRAGRFVPRGKTEWMQ